MDAYRAAKLRLFAELLPRGAPAVAQQRDWIRRRCAALRDIAARRGLRSAHVGEGGDGDPTAAQRCRARTASG